MDLGFSEIVVLLVAVLIVFGAVWLGFVLVTFLTRRS